MMLSQQANCQPGNCGVAWADRPMINSSAKWTDCWSIKQGVVISLLSHGLTTNTVMRPSSLARGGQAALCLSPAMFHGYALHCNSVHKECTTRRKSG